MIGKQGQIQSLSKIFYKSVKTWHVQWILGVLLNERNGDNQSNRTTLILILAKKNNEWDRPCLQCLRWTKAKSLICSKHIRASLLHPIPGGNNYSHSGDQWIRWETHFWILKWNFIVGSLLFHHMPAGLQRVKNHKVEECCSIHFYRYANSSVKQFMFLQLHVSNYTSLLFLSVTFWAANISLELLSNSGLEGYGGKQLESITLPDREGKRPN